MNRMSENMEESMVETTEEIVEGKGNKKRSYVGDKARCKKSNAKKTYSKKRRYHPPKNKKTTNETTTKSTTHKKVVGIVVPNEEGSESYVSGYHLFDIGVLGNLISDLLCPETLYMDTDNSKRNGLASYVMINCVCGYSRGEFTSPVIQKDGKRSSGQAFDVNYRSVCAMRACGLGLSGLETFGGMMNMSPPLTKKYIIVLYRQN